MEEKEEMVEEPKEVKQEPKETKEIHLSMKFINLCLAGIALVLVILYRVLLNFGVYNGVLHGIMAIVVYGLPLFGLVWAYMRDKKPTFEFWANTIVLSLALLGY